MIKKQLSNEEKVRVEQALQSDGDWIKSRTLSPDGDGGVLIEKDGVGIFQYSGVDVLDIVIDGEHCSRECFQDICFSGKVKNGAVFLFCTTKHKD